MTELSFKEFFISLAKAEDGDKVVELINTLNANQVLSSLMMLQFWNAALNAKLHEFAESGEIEICEGSPEECAECIRNPDCGHA